MPKGSRRGAKAAEREVLERDPGRPAPPLPEEQEPEDPAERPCRCVVCEKVPVSTRTPPGALEERFLGVYPRGLKDTAVSELVGRGCEVLVDLEEHCVLLFRTAEAVELGSFLLLCEVPWECALGKSCRLFLPQSPTLHDIARVAREQVCSASTFWRRGMRPYQTWRVSVYRSGATHRWRSPEVAVVIGEAIAPAGSIALSPTCTAGPQVDLVSYDIEVIAFVSDGVDELAVAAGAQRAGLVGKHEELLVLGLRTPSTKCRQVTLAVQKGDLLSRADDTVALCIAQMASSVLHRGGPGKALMALDPMCGVGTYLFALQWALARESISAELLGVDAELESLAHARANTSRQGQRLMQPQFLAGSSRTLPFGSNAIDLIVVDPPWGQRHSRHTYVKQHLYAWAREWARVLRPGGVALVITICTKHFENQVMRYLEKEGCLILEDGRLFDNKGWTQCKVYTLRKPAKDCRKVLAVEIASSSVQLSLRDH